MDRSELLDRFQLDDQMPGDHQIWTQITDDATFEDNGQYGLSNEWNRAFAELDVECLLVDALEKSGAERAMHFDGGCEKGPCGHVDSPRRLAQSRGVRGALAVHSLFIGARGTELREIGRMMSTHRSAGRGILNRS